MAALARQLDVWILIGSIGVRAADGRINNRSYMLKPDGNTFRAGPDYAATVAPHYFNYRKTSIYAGSNEIQHNIMAKMVLGL